MLHCVSHPSSSKDSDPRLFDIVPSSTIVHCDDATFFPIKLENEIKPEDKLINYIKEITEIDNLDLNVSLISLGIDSLISISITNFCKVELNLEVKQSDLLNGLSINDIIEASNRINNAK